uniref:Uncharacterized protein n=1 Tax=Gasterosteus aculeatus TaxID=69293 RepID=G3NBQ3_GASAC
RNTKCSSKYILNKSNKGQRQCGSQSRQVHCGKDDVTGAPVRRWEAAKCFSTCRSFFFNKVLGKSSGPHCMKPAVLPSQTSRVICLNNTNNKTAQPNTKTHTHTHAGEPSVVPSLRPKAKCSKTLK